MSVINIPFDILPGRKFSTGEPVIADFIAPTKAFKGKCIFHTNVISLIISGKKTMHFADKTITLSASEYHLMSAGNFVARLDLHEEEPFRAILIFFDNETLSDFLVAHPDFVQVAKKKKPTEVETHLSFKNDEFIENYISSIKLLLKSGKAFSSRMQRLKFEELLLYILEKDASAILSLQSSTKTQLNTIELRKAVETNISKNLTIEELAFLCNLSVSSFKRRFAEIYECPPNRWILQRRMEIAAKLLKNSNQKPSEVFYKIGYENYPAFSKSFKKFYGVSPKEFS